jgi:hypothetical protein
MGTEIGAVLSAGEQLRFYIGHDWSRLIFGLAK